MARQSGFKIMRRLIVELKPLTKFMMMTIILGVLGFLAAISIATFAAIAIVDVLGQGIGINFTTAIKLMIICALIRGPLRYGEQLCGHYIAFKILAILRDKVFTVLRRLAPAKLESKEKGNLVSLITADIELLEVFYAHTVAPISIALLTNSIITAVLYWIHPLFGGIALLFFILVGLIIPYFSSKFAKEDGSQYREAFGKANSYLLDSLRGLKEILIFKNGSIRAGYINTTSEELNQKQAKLKFHEGVIRGTADLSIMMAIITFLVVGSNLALSNEISLGSMIIAIVIIASSFGPVVALSNLSNNLLQTFASAQRLFDLLDEEPEVEEIPGRVALDHLDIEYDRVSFSYQGREEVLKDISISIPQGDKIAVVGESGTGKSTFVKLLMRFWDSNEGEIILGGKNIKRMPTNTLRDNQVLMSQDTYLFSGTIADNIRMGDLEATNEAIIEAAKKASLHDFIMTLPQKYETKIGELGANFSSGEKQRIGLARAFLHKGNLLILDEPTSNLDTLNEKQILLALKENMEAKTIILITHRKSSASICRKTYKIENKNLVKT
ncbi:amino acid ABC transporter ATP-binding/permease protein [Alkaliphilus transvaalensis]|uniref:amino acid ABC transporter ATP-binding/permease protein n=1 Tax=Alkaliphilus transvaalensis TaxID=114628 RepID=UPI00047B1C2C|nr:ABC transporter ATP-binding protein [Alkaliphilus transvaalensis]